MFRSLFNNMPNVVKNLGIINALFFLATVVMEQQGIDLVGELGVYYISSPNFQPFQLITHFFMHGGFMHIFFNMFALVVFGAHLERRWGPKKFLLFYFLTAMGAVVLHMGVQGFEIYQLTGEFFPAVESADYHHVGGGMIETSIRPAKYNSIYQYLLFPTVGASGAVYGLIAAFAMLFPDVKLMLMFPPIPIKAKWLAIGLGVFALYQGYQDADGDSVAHFAHLGGMILGVILVKIWQKRENTFY